MRVIRQREIERLIKENLTEEERKRYEESFQIPLSSFEDMRRGSDIQGPLLLKAIGCFSKKDFSAFQNESLALAEKVLEGDVSRYTKERVSAAYRSALGNLARKYARKRKCHLNFRGFVCYCDEYNH